MNELYNLYLQFPHICTDTRNITQGCLFFCLKGDNFDGNTFALQALAAGAARVVTEDKMLAAHEHCIVVDDVLHTLQALAIYHRQQLRIPVIGITGTNGKTTTKELIMTVLSKKFHVTCTQGNFNNHIGVPLTLLSINADTEIAIVEMGANHVGEIADLCHIAQPTHGLITNIGRAHLEGFGSIENIITTKRAIYEFLIRHESIIFINDEDEILRKCVGKYRQLVKYGNTPDSTCQGTVTALNPYLGVQIDDVQFDTQLTGEYNLINILCAVAVGLHFGVTLPIAAQAIADYQPQNNRSQLDLQGSNVVIADYYNANPSSMHAALINLVHLPDSHKIAILGDMLELGEVSDEEHQKVIDFCLQNKIQALFVGETFARIGKQEAQTFETIAELNDYLSQNPIQNSTILIKGSRGIHLEKIVIPQK
ncbi:MAG: UDP-N-acetylmuramoyl-tripeptide--D-alanyl-D-alanine ligase [Bacteroidales bacterium]|jgi:UDP-N-acetylmuramoyl-tripeptide--D-alanyl-D-alanine ligase|nr:UDP-N-acetylmuramoyl-tripeptide--D-alanyl-D-alanine ligase [Bacteroidales bacterium]MDD4395096.1 UDP-N-acetylmuramoyl-tripeptide--D-alanyl-D-alanine ligase [Bacteroidales bacterium]